MCRWMAYMGAPIPIEDLLFTAEHNLIDQSRESRLRASPTNGDGFGLGWYGGLETPGLFRSIRPAWNDANLRELAAQIRSPMFVAHVRAATLARVQETNCHPFRHGRWLFVHNGQIAEADRTRQELLCEVAPEVFDNLMGTTDSELMFHLALTYGLEDDPFAALQRMVGRVEVAARERGVDPAVWMTVAVTDGKRLWVVRYASDGEAPTLFLSPSVDHIYKVNPAVRGHFGDHARAVVSEPLGHYPQIWEPVPQGSAVLVFEDGHVELESFRPAA